LAPSLRDTWAAFTAAYSGAAPRPPDGLTLGGHLACIVLARTDGLSLEPGLADGARERARSIGVTLLRRPLTDPMAIWSVVDHALV
jgi:hypothetical protein